MGLFPDSHLSFFDTSFLTSENSAIDLTLVSSHLGNRKKNEKDLIRLLRKVNELILKELRLPNTAGVLTTSCPLLGSFFCASSFYKTEIHSTYRQRGY